jgi:hypothetical protein
MKKIITFLFLAIALTAFAAAEDWIPCTETDGGNDYPVKGTTTGSHFSQGTYWTMSETDYCSDYQNYMVEYYCDSENFNPEEFRKEEVWCEFGCEEGACMPEPEVPEFGLIAGCIAFIGAIGAFFALRK